VLPFRQTVVSEQTTFTSQVVVASLRLLRKLWEPPLPAYGIEKHCGWFTATKV